MNLGFISAESVFSSKNYIFNFNSSTNHSIFRPLQIAANKYPCNWASSPEPSPSRPSRGWCGNWRACNKSCGACATWPRRCGTTPRDSTPVCYCVAALARWTLRLFIIMQLFSFCQAIIQIQTLWLTSAGLPLPNCPSIFCPWSLPSNYRYYQPTGDISRDDF